MTRPAPCGTSLQKRAISDSHAAFMGAWKSMFSEKRTCQSRGQEHGAR